MSGRAEPFEYVHLNGERFQRGLLPVGAVSELQRYQRLLVDLAKHLFLQENPDRKRASLKALDLASEDLLITALHDGSTGVDLAVRRTDAGYFTPTDYMERSRVLIEEAFASLSDEGELIDAFPSELVPQLAGMGQNIPAGETYTWAKQASDWQTSRARLTRDTTVPIRREKDSEPQEKLIHVFIVGICSDPLTFEYKNAANGKTLHGSYTDANLFGLLKENTEMVSRAPLVALTVLANIDDEAIVDVLGVEQVLPPEWSRRLDELSELPDGWLDGAGKGISPSAMRAVESLLFMVADERLPRPGIYATEEGGIHLEWGDARDTDVVIDPAGSITLYSDDLDDDGVHAGPDAILEELTRCLND